MAPQTFTGPEILDGVEGLAVTTVSDLQEGALLPQPLLATTQIDPEFCDELKLTVTELLPCPEVIVAPAGAVQLYELAPATREIA